MVLILGDGKSGKGAKKLLEGHGVKCLLYDDKTPFYVDYDRIEYIVKSPGFNDNHEIIIKAKSKDIDIISEIELAYRYRIGEKKIIAVTGTNGKTTTTSMIGEMIKSDHYTAGNIGTAWSAKCEEDKMAVLELSSFQLADIDSFRPNVAVITNIAPDHIEYHGGFDEYKRAKFNIFKNQTDKNYLVVSKSVYDNELLGTITDITPRIFVFSDRCMVDNGTYSIGDKIYFSLDNQTKEIASFNEFNLKGKHNRENILAALCVVMILGEDINYAKNKLAEFLPPHHRQELVCEINGIKFVDDSKATNVHATLSALSNYKNNVILLLGGSDKGESFDDIFKDNGMVKEYILFGATGNKLENCIKAFNLSNYTKFRNFNEAVAHAIIVAKSGDTVLLSPACASFDEFNSYAERGDYFLKKLRSFRSF